jgi:hypothetical protein
VVSIKGAEMTKEEDKFPPFAGMTKKYNSNSSREKIPLGVVENFQ